MIRINLLLRGKTSKNLLLYGIGQGFNLITPLIISPHLINVCGLKNYGKVGVAMAFAFFVMVIIDYGIDILGVKEIITHKESKDKLQNFFLVSYAARLLLLVSVCLLCTLLFFIIPLFSSEKLLFYLTFFMLIGQYINPTWFLQGMDDFIRISILNILSKIIFLILVFVFIKTPADYIFVNLFMGIGMIISFSYGLLYCIKKQHFKISRVSYIETFDYLKSGYKFCISQIFLSFKNYSPIILISFLGGYNIAGFYKVIEQITTLFRTYLQIFFKFFYPKICFLISKNKEEGIYYWKKINLVNIFFVLALISIVFLFSHQILTFFKISPRDMGKLVYLLRLALVLPFLTSITYSLEQLLFGLGKNAFYVKNTIVSVVLNFLMMYLLFNTFELKGLISTLMITEIMVISVYSIYLYSYFKEDKIV